MCISPPCSVVCVGTPFLVLCCPCLIIAGSFCSFSVSLSPNNNFFCQQSVLLLCSCLIIFMLNITNPGKALLQICVHGRLFFAVFTFVFILILFNFYQTLICRVFIYYHMDAQFIYRVLVEDGCFLKSLVLYSLFI